MENKQLQQAKDTIAKKYGYENYNMAIYGSSREKPMTDMSKYVNEVAIEYHRLMSECDVDEEKEEQPILIGYLNKEFGFANHLPVKEGTKVYLHKDRYFFNAKSFGGLDDKMTFYKETLHNAIDFI
ncbi:MAG: hypothetical protein KBF36_11525 [Chitinophagaceae bacterium]|jgi:hypothetical protein|nr:hypothetical protein [Chitinophagaceae bacterium]